MNYSKMEFLRPSPGNRRRSRRVALGLMLATACCESTVGFVPSFNTGVGFPTSARISASPIVLEATSSKAYANNALTTSPARLTSEEQQELLQQAVELRRIKQVESELALRNKKTGSLLSVRCKEVGYGEDIGAYEKAISNGERARESLITTNMGLVYYCVGEIIGKKNSRRSRLNSLSREDLIQEGSIGLARAIDRWNPDIGGKFSTYAVYWVRAAILRCIAEKDDMLRVPEHVSAAVRKMSRGAQKLGIDIDSQDLLSSVYYTSNASWKEAQVAKALAEEAGLTDKQLSEALKIRKRRLTGGYIAFESWMQQGKDLAADVSTDVARDESLHAMEVEDLKKTLSRYLRPKEMEALFWRYGLFSDGGQASPKSGNNQKNYLRDAEERVYGSNSSAPSEIPVRGRWGEAMSFSEVGKKMEVSAEYGRRLCHAALKKLRQAAKEGHIEPALLY